MPTAFNPDFRIVLFSSPLMEQSAHELMDAGFPPTQSMLCAFGDYMEAQQARLPDIPDIEQISPRVIRVLGQNPGKFALQGTNTYIVGTGPQRLIVDTGQGEPKWAALIASTLSILNITFSCVLLTHWHLDHSGGVSDLIRLYPELSASIYKNSPGRGQQSISDGQVFAVEGAKLRAVHTPGHSDDHMCFILEEDNAIFTGDHVVSHCSAAFEELSAWMESLRTLQSYNCQFGYPAHGEVIQELPQKLEYELASKERRELRVLRALAGIKKSVMPGNNGGVTVRQLVDSMYGTDLESRVKEVAIEPAILQLLRKLAADGKVAFEIRGGIRKWFAI